MKPAPEMDHRQIFAREKAKEIQRELLLLDIIMVIVGVLLVIYPGTSAELICRITGCVLALWGVIRAIAYFITVRDTPLNSFGLVHGAFLIGAGAYLIFRPVALVSFLTAALALLILVGGILKLQYAIELSNLRARRWYFELLGAAVMIALAVIIFINPFKAANVLMMFIGIAFVINGVWDLISVLMLMHHIRKSDKAHFVHDHPEEEPPKTEDAPPAPPAP